MATIVYLDADDEITSAAARIRPRPTRGSRSCSRSGRGSRRRGSTSGCSPREAMRHGKRLDIVAPGRVGAGARGLGRAAGVRVGGGVRGGARRADDGDATTPPTRRGAAGRGGPARRPSARAAAGGPGGAGGREPAAGATAADRPSRDTVPRSASAPDRGAGLERLAAREAELERRRRGRGRRGSRSRSRAGAVRAGALRRASLSCSLGLGAAAVAAATSCPPRDITVTPHIEPVGPDPAHRHRRPRGHRRRPRGRGHPGRDLDVPVTVSQRVPGDRQPRRGDARDRAASAGGTATRRRPTRSRPARSCARTGGDGFATDEEVFLPVALISGPAPTSTSECHRPARSASRPSRPARTATSPAGADPRRPGRATTATSSAVDEPRADRRRHPRGVHRGSRRRTWTPRSRPSRAAPGPVRERAREPGAGAPRARPCSRRPRSSARRRPTSDPETLVGQEVATVHARPDGDRRPCMAVDSTPIEAIAEDGARGGGQRRASELVPGSISVDVGEGTVGDGVVTFQVDGRREAGPAARRRPLRQQVLGPDRGRGRGRARAVRRRRDPPVAGLRHDRPDVRRRVTLVIIDPVDDTSAATRRPSPRRRTRRRRPPTAGLRRAGTIRLMRSPLAGRRRHHPPARRRSRRRPAASCRPVPCR